MLMEKPELPIQWTLPVPKPPRWFAPILSLLGMAMLSIAVSRRDWFGSLLPMVTLLNLWAMCTTERFARYELTYAAAYGPPQLLSTPPSNIEWGKVQRVEFLADGVRLYRNRYWSPLVLKLPGDPALREQIFAVIRLKAAHALDVARPQAHHDRPREQNSRPLP